MTLLDINIFICFLYLAIPRMGTLLVYIQTSTFDNYRKIDRIFSFSSIWFIFVHLFIL